jgi:hypothetical protein
MPESVMYHDGARRAAPGHTPPIPEWKESDAFRDALPGR